MSRLPKKNASASKKGWAVKPLAGKKNIPPKKRPTLQERLNQKADLSKRPGRDRRFITAKEICIVMDCSERKAYRVIKLLREKYGKQPHVPVTLQEFCQYVRLTKEEEQRIGRL
jgi:hypothetical protein